MHNYGGTWQLDLFHLQEKTTKLLFIVVDPGAVPTRGNKKTAHPLTYWE